MSQAAGETGEGANNVSNNLTTLVPSFDPSKDDLEQYTQKVELLGEIWPQSKLNELITRLMLNTTGTAFQKLQLNRDKLLTNDKAGIQLLITTLGGQWGKVNLERKYETVEKALFKCVQRQDESNDSFLARCDVNWSELKSKKIDLDEVHAYIILRGSLLSTEDKKRVIVESGADKEGTLTVDKVSKSVRMLGTAFFNEMIGQKKTRGKIYDSQALVVEDEDENHPESQVFATEEITEEEFYESLLQEADEDAALVADYESAMADAVQSDEDLAAAFTSYSEARKRLSDRFKNRGFWPVGPTKGKGKGYPNKGRGKSFGKFPKKSLQQRILESSCRLCGKKGHWKAECPERSRGSVSTSAAGTSAAMTTTAEPHDDASVPNALPMEFMQLPLIHEAALDEPSMHEINVVTTIPHALRERLRMKGYWGVSQKNPKSHDPRNESLAAKHMEIQNDCTPFEPEMILFSTHGTSGILDTGATKSVIGSKLLPAFIESLPHDVRKNLCRTRCEITFRFGNQGTLDSQQALVIPLTSIGLGLKVAIVEGETPLLLSNTLIRTLRASINSERQVLSSPFLHSDVKLQLTPKGLYMLDIRDLIQAQKGPHQRTPLSTAETFVSSDFSECQNSASDPSIAVEAKGIQVSVLKSPSGPQTCQKVYSSSRCQEYVDQPVHAEISRPETTSPKFLELVQSLQDRQSHEPRQSGRSSHDPTVSRRSRSLRTEDARGDGQLQDFIWQSTCGQAIHRDVGEREGMDQVVRQNLLQQSTRRTQKADHLCREDGATARDQQWSPNTGGNGDAKRDRTASWQGTSHSQSVSQHDEPGIHRYNDSHERRSQRPMGCDGAHPHHANEHAASRGHECLAEPCSRHGEYPDGNPEPLASRAVRCPMDHLCLAGDIDQDFEPINFHSNQMNHRQKKFQAFVNQFTTEMTEVSSKPSIRSEPMVQVMEVLCGPQSELTKQVNNMGYRAVRFGYQEGDVATKEGRELLFRKIHACNPKHVWYSPTCGPWCAWSQLNESKSEASFQRIQGLRDENLYQLALGLVLYRHQISRGCHMHWEQPAKSIMLRTPLLKEVIQGTQVAEFDMCRVGLMRDPVNQLLYKKGMEIATTSQQFYQQFHGRTCNHQHEHQQLAGETIFKGIRIRRTEFSERYNRKFARALAKVLTKVSCAKEVPFVFASAFAVANKRRSSASSAPPLKRAKLRNSELIEPAEMPAKRRRTSGKTPEATNTSALCDRICSQISQIAPRVGRKEIDKPQILADLQELFHEKQIVRVVACKGTERTIMPPKDLVPDEAPFRRAIIVQRVTKRVLVEDQWEEWKYLSNRQLWRRSHPCFLNITVFARNPETSDPSVASVRIQASEPANAEQSQASERPDTDMPETGPAARSPTDETPIVSPMQRPNPEPNHESLDPSAIDEASTQHGPKFMSMNPEDKKIAIRLHKNLGHPDPQKLSKVLQQRGYSQELYQGVLDLKCSTCQMQQRPKLQRPATLKEELEFGDKVSIDGIKWRNKQNQEFHFYHFIDHGTNYHTAVIAPNRAEIQERFISGWLNWAGTPNTVLMDSASEFLSSSFQEYMQSMNVPFVVVPPDAHWQIGRIERHGGVLQNMLGKYELEHDVTNYQQLQQALMHCTMAKNACGLRHGYSPETLVFGKGLRVPGSLVSDDTLPAHAIANAEGSQGVRFRELLAKRETARKAFHAADNDMSLRRAALRRDRPSRGAYEPGEWVMIWKVHLNQGSWIGPAKVVIQEGATTVFCNNSGTLVRAAPEHVRPVSAVEAQLIPLEEQLKIIHGNNTTTSNLNPDPMTSRITGPNVSIPPADNMQSSSDNHQRTISNASSDQPDQEPDNVNTPHAHNPNSNNHINNSNNPTTQELEPHEVPIPDDSSDELLCDLLTCMDDDDPNENLCPKGDTNVWRAELEFSKDQLESACQSHTCPTEEEFLFLATNTKKQRTEVKLSSLTPEERLEFESAKAKEVQNWLQTGTVEKMFRHELSPSQILRCRWLYVWKPLTEIADQQDHGGKQGKPKQDL